MRKSITTTQGTPMKRNSQKAGIEKSLVKRGQIFCVNHEQNKTPYWGGETCDTHIDHDPNVVQWVCSTCVAKMMPAPAQKQTTPTVDPTTGEKRKRGRPKGSKNKTKTISTATKTTRKGKK